MLRSFVAGTDRDCAIDGACIPRSGIFCIGLLDGTCLLAGGLAGSRGALFGPFSGVAAGWEDFDPERFQGGGTASACSTLGQARSGGSRCSGGVSFSSLSFFAVARRSWANPLIGFGGT